MKHMRTKLAAMISTMLLAGTSALAQSPGKPHGGPPPPPGSQNAPTNNAPPAGSTTPAPANTGGAVHVHGQSAGASAAAPGAAKGKKGKKGKTNHPPPGGAAPAGAPSGSGGH